MGSLGWPAGGEVASFALVAAQGGYAALLDEVLGLVEGGGFGAEAIVGCLLEGWWASVLVVVGGHVDEDELAELAGLSGVSWPAGHCVSLFARGEK